MMRELCSALSAAIISLFPQLLISFNVPSLVQEVCFTSRCKTHCNTLLMQPVFSHYTLSSVLKSITILKSFVDASS